MADNRPDSVIGRPSTCEAVAALNLVPPHPHPAKSNPSCVGFRGMGMGSHRRSQAQLESVSLQPDDRVSEVNTATRSSGRVGPTEVEPKENGFLCFGPTSVGPTRFFLAHVVSTRGLWMG